MSDAAYQNAIAKRDRLIKELEEVNSFLRMYSRFAGRHPSKEDKPGTDTQIPTTVHNRAPRSVTLKALAPRRKEMGPTLREILLAHGAPMTRGQLLAALAERGMPVPGRDPSKNIGTIMWRLKEFINIEGYGYWPKDVSCSAVGYYAVVDGVPLPKGKQATIFDG